MVLVPAGATTKVTLDEALSGIITDAKGKAVKFKPVKDTDPPRYEGKGTDKQTYGFALGDQLVDVTATATTDLKALRKKSKGFPVPKNEAKKIDEEIEKEEKEGKEEEEPEPETDTDAETPAAVTVEPATLTTTTSPSKSDSHRRTR